MYTHRMCVVFVPNLLSAPSQLIAQGASQCFALSQGTKGGSEARRKKQNIPSKGMFLFLFMNQGHRFIYLQSLTKVLDPC